MFITMIPRAYSSRQRWLLPSRCNAEKEDVTATLFSSMLDYSGLQTIYIHWTNKVFETSKVRLKVLDLFCRKENVSLYFLGCWLHEITQTFTGLKKNCGLNPVKMWDELGLSVVFQYKITKMTERQKKKS